MSYELLPTSDPSQRDNASSPSNDRSDTKSTKSIRTHPLVKLIFTRLLVAFVVMFLAFSGLRSLTLSRSASRTAWSSGVGSACHRNGSLKAGLSTLPSHFELPSGDKIPSVALGVWKAKPGEVGAAVKTALKTGYRHIDDAWIYGNEKEVGQAIRESGVPRQDIWLTSKLWNSFHAPEDIEPALDESLNNLGTEYLDLYLIHWPIAFRKGGSGYDKELTENTYPTWQKLEEMVEKGKVRNIGLSNFNIRRIQNLTANPLKIKPAALQVELSYWNPQPDLVKWAKENNLPVEAYSPLGGDKQVKETLQLPVVKKIANQLGMTPAQVIISWHIQRGTIVLPKSVTPSRVVENFQVAALPDDLFTELEEAAVSHKPLRTMNPSKDWGLDFDVFDD
ncbi:hypothetical protein ACEPAH_9123 [Sanghuangporus vaninii]